MSFGLSVLQGHDFGMRTAGTLGMSLSQHLALRIHNDAAHPRIGRGDAHGLCGQIERPLHGLAGWQRAVEVGVHGYKDTISCCHLAAHPQRRAGSAMSPFNLHGLLVFMPRDGDAQFLQVRRWHVGDRNADDLPSAHEGQVGVGGG